MKDLRMRRASKDLNFKGFKMKFSDYITQTTQNTTIVESAKSANQDIYNFQLANDSEVSNISVTKDKLSVRYFQRHRKTGQDDKAFKELAGKVFKGKKYTIEYGDFENTAIVESSIIQISKFAEKCVKAMKMDFIFSDSEFFTELDKKFKKFGGSKIIKTKQDYIIFVNSAITAVGISTAQGLGLYDSPFVNGLEGC